MPVSYTTPCPALATNALTLPKSGPSSRPFSATTTKYRLPGSRIASSPSMPPPPIGTNAWFVYGCRSNTPSLTRPFSTATGWQRYTDNPDVAPAPSGYDARSNASLWNLLAVPPLAGVILVPRGAAA